MTHAMDEHEVIAEMNRLWALLSASDMTTETERDTRNAFVQYQQWLSKRDFAYYQEPKTGTWKLAEGQAQYG